MVAVFYLLLANNIQIRREETRLVILQPFVTSLLDGLLQYQNIAPSPFHESYPSSPLPESSWRVVDSNTKQKKLSRNAIITRYSLFRYVQWGACRPSISESSV
jgi:hypothetical protein